MPALTIALSEAVRAFCKVCESGRGFLVTNCKYVYANDSTAELPELYV